MSAWRYAPGKERQEAIDICLASNIIEVGVDIDRLALMTIVGQAAVTRLRGPVDGDDQSRADFLLPADPTAHLDVLPSTALRAGGAYFRHSICHAGPSQSASRCRGRLCSADRSRDTH
jgi:hypothetical protein